MGLVNTTKSLMGKKNVVPKPAPEEVPLAETGSGEPTSDAVKMPPEDPDYVPAPDDADADVDTDREGQTDEGANALPAADPDEDELVEESREAAVEPPAVRVTRFHYTSIGANGGTLHVTGTKANGVAFTEQLSAPHNATLDELGNLAYDILKKNGDPRFS